MFQSATLKLTAWYLGIIMAVSFLFSVAIYQLNFHEVSVRLENLQRGIVTQTVGPTLITITNNDLRRAQAEQAAIQMLLSLVYINLVILVGGGFGSYLLARRTLRPIEKAHEAQSRFTSDASHELRTPLTAMKTELEVTLRDQNLSIEEARELLESNLEEVDKLINLSNMLLNLSRLDYDRLEKEPVDLVAELNEALKAFKKDKKRFEVSSRKDAVVVANRAAVNELITILVDNALKYSSPGTRIVIRIFQRLRSFGFEITNEGPTIDEAALPKLFDRFYRADTSRTSSHSNGYGLGLAIAKKIVDIHEGDMSVTSAKNKTVFTFYLPIVRSAKSENKQ